MCLQGPLRLDCFAICRACRQSEGLSRATPIDTSDAVEFSSSRVLEFSSSRVLEFSSSVLAKVHLVTAASDLSISLIFHSKHPISIYFRMSQTTRLHGDGSRPILAIGE